MKKALTLTALILLITTSAAAESIFSLDININRNDTVDLNSFNITEGEPSAFRNGDYTIRTLDENSNALYSQNFSNSFTVVYDVIPNTSTTSESETRNTTRKLLRIPYSYEAESIQILNSGKELYSLDIPDRVCKNNDDKCPEYCINREIDSDCQTEDKQETAGILSWILNFVEGIF